MFGSAELVVEGNQNSAAVKNRIGRDQPLRLVGHDDRGAVIGLEIGVLQGTCQRRRDLSEVRVGETSLLFSRSTSIRQVSFGQRATASRNAAPKLAY